MKIRKSLAGVAALSLAAAGIGIAVAPTATAATGGPYTLAGAPINQAGGASYGGTPTVQLTATQVGSNVQITADVSVGPTTTSFAGFNAGEYRLDAYVRIDGGPQIQLTGTPGVPAVPPSSVSYPSGTSATATISGLSAGPHTVVLQSLAVDSSGPSSGGGFATSWAQLAGFDALYNFSATVPGVVADPPTTPIGLSQGITVTGPAFGISAISGQSVTTAARANNVVTVADIGALFTGTSISSVTVGGAAAVNTLAISGGALTGTVTVPAGATVGNTTISVTTDTETVSTPIQILGTPTLTLAPASGGASATVTVTGSNFNPLQAATLLACGNGTVTVPAFCTGAPGAENSAGTASVGATGAFSGTITTSATMTNDLLIQGAQGSGPTAVAASATFGYNPDFCIRQVGTDPVTPCDTKQNVTATVSAGALTQQANSAGLPGYSSTQITYAPVTTSTAVQVAPGQINPITITDARGGLATFSLTAAVTDSLDNGSTGTLADANLVLGPVTCADQPGSATGITEGAGGAFGGTLTICDSSTNAADSDGDTTGGQWVANADLDLTIPAFQQTGTYNGTITFTLT